MTAPGFFLLEDTLTPLLAIGGAATLAEAEEIALRLAPDILDYAKDNAPWEDRTGDARAGLDIDVDEDNDEVTITLYHTVDYGLYLEVIESGKFATIMPTLEHYADQVFVATHAVSTGEDLSNYE